MSHLFYGVAYYDEYMPEDRLAKDIALMRETGINVVRIAESTWSTLEPEEGQYNFYSMDLKARCYSSRRLNTLPLTLTPCFPRRFT